MNEMLDIKGKTVLVVANVSAGKSTLINSLVNANVCKSTNFVCTSKIAKIACCFGNQKSYKLGNKIFENSSESAKIAEIGFDKILLYDNGILFEECVTFIDTPGTNNAMENNHEKITLKAIQKNEYDLLIFVSNVTTQMTDDEASLLKYIRNNCQKKVLVVVNKIDNLSKDESVDTYLKSYNEELKKMGVYPEAVIPVSAFGYQVLMDKDNDDYDFYLRKFSQKSYDLPSKSLFNNPNVNPKEERNESNWEYSGISFLRKSICEILNNESKVTNFLSSEDLYFIGKNFYLGENDYIVDNDKAFEHLKLASEKGHVYASGLLGHMYFYGNGVEVDLKKAVDLMTPAANNRFIIAQNCLGDFYYELEDYELSYKWYRDSADLGDLYGLLQTAKCYYYGNGVNVDFDKALELLLKCAASKYEPCYYYLGSIYLDMEDYEKAYGWVVKSSESGNAIATAILGEMYMKGLYVEQDISMAKHLFENAIECNVVPAMNDLAELYYKEEKYKESFDLYNKAAEAGDPEGIFRLAFFYYFGNGVRKNKKKAISFLLRSAELAFEDSYYYLARVYFDNEEYDNSFFWYKKSADCGIYSGMCGLGMLYFLGKGVESDFDEALKWFNLAAEGNYLDAFGWLGLMYESGKGISIDLEKAMYYYKRASDLGDHNSQECYARLLFDKGYNFYYGQNGFKENDALAYECFCESSELGNITAKAILGEMYYFGIYVDKDVSKAKKFLEITVEEDIVDSLNLLARIYRDENKWDDAFKLSKRSADYGNAEGCCCVGKHYLFGISVKKNTSHSLSYLMKSAEQEYDESYLLIGDIYYEKKDYGNAFFWYQKSASAGYYKGMFNLGNLYFFGEGVESDFIEAYEWYSKASEGDHDGAFLFLGIMCENGYGVAKNKRKAMSYYRKAAKLGNEKAKVAIEYNGIRNIP